MKLATVFSGIGAIEQALHRMGIHYEIVFACDNGDVELNLLEGKDLDDFPDVPTDQIDVILDDNQNLHWYEKKLVRLFHDRNNRSAYTTYVITEDENGQIQKVMTAKYSYSEDIAAGDLPNINDARTMRDYFTSVINNYLNNGNLNQ